VSAYLDEYRERFGVEAICRVLDVSASAYYERRTGERAARAIEDERLLSVIEQLHESLGDLPPAEFEALYAPQTETTITL